MNFCNSPSISVPISRSMGCDHASGSSASKTIRRMCIETVCNRYLWEILALPVKTPFFVGGNCQGGILALALARRLKQIGRSPSLLILMEWTYSYGRYTQPTLLLYGDQSSYRRDLSGSPHDTHRTGGKTFLRGPLRRFLARTGTSSATRISPVLPRSSGGTSVPPHPSGLPDATVIAVSRFKIFGRQFTGPMMKPRQGQRQHNRITTNISQLLIKSVESQVVFPTRFFRMSKICEPLQERSATIVTASPSPTRWRLNSITWPKCSPGLRR